MLEGENGAAPSNTSGDSKQRAIPSSPLLAGARSASPAKRSAADMESGKQNDDKVPESFTQEQDTGPTDFDVAMSGMTPAGQVGGDTQTTAASSIAASLDGSVDTPTTSMQSDQDPVEANKHAAQLEPYSPERMAQQAAHVQLLVNKPLDEGTRGVAISTKWLARVLSRTLEGAQSSDFPKEAREGLVGPLDNSDILALEASDPPVLIDLNSNKPFVPLKPGLSFGEDFEMVPYEAYGYIIGEYGHVKEQPPPIRYAHNTAEAGAAEANIIYEIYPPVITVRKMPQSVVEEDVVKAKSSLEALRLKKDREGRRQLHDGDAAILVSSRTERVKKFLTRAKEAAGIPIQTKVKVWRVLDASNVAVDRPENVKSGVLSPPASRSSSPSKSTRTRLVVDAEAFSKLEVGRDIEELDVKDETNNDKYNGKSEVGTVGLFQDCTIILEEQKGGPGGGEFASDTNNIAKRNVKNGAGPRAGSAPSSGRTSPAPGNIMARGRPTLRKDGRTRGCTGLTNLGNTCYMNSALQCIRSVEELACYFLAGKYKGEINNDNPLGHHGAMANVYAGVLKGIYDSNSNVFGPQEFKRTLGRLQPMFSGYGQQDSQEFLSFLVDALHEDLNRIKKKPYLENPDSDDNKVKDPEYIRELGEVYRSNHQKRNDSIAMDLFSGFYKNTMECPVCDKVSVTFDPYSLLTVQLPMDHAFQHSVCFVPLHGKPVIHEIDMDKMSTIKALKEYVASKHVGVEASKMWIAEVWSHKLYKVFDDSMTLADAGIAQNDYIFMYQLDDVPKNAPTGKRVYSGYGSKSEDSIPADGMASEKADVFAVPIFSRTAGKFSNSHEMTLFPLYITLTREQAKDYETILKKILIAVSNITSRPILKEFAEEAAPPAVNDTEDVTQITSSDDAAGVSDHSAQSEEDYVKVSLGKQAASPMQVDGTDSSVPDGFMDPQYFLSPALRNQLFDIQYNTSHDNGLHCTNTNIGGWRGDSLSPLFDRVKPQRRASVQSSASENSTSTSGSAKQGNEESEESDADDDEADKPDIVLGDTEMPLETVEDSDDELNGPNTYNRSRAGRRRKEKRGKGKNRHTKRNGMIKYGKKSDSSYGQGRATSGVSLAKQDLEDSPYYIQLGEAIILDWRAEAFDSLFGGSDDLNEMRGRLLVSDDGRSGTIFEDEELQTRKAKRAARKKHGATLEDCFAETGKREKLSEDNAWYCNRCKELRQAYKQLEIWTLPDILVVHMKRFGGGRAMRDKIDILVDYPIEELDMSDKVGLKEDGKEYVYDLFAVDCHFGGLGGGHYTAMAKNFFDGSWYNYNDSSCSAVTNAGALKTSAAYLLFYRRRSNSPLGPPELQKIVTDYRNPQLTNGDECDENEAGEARLGGPVHSLQHQHGSSSALVGAGAVGTSRIDANGSLGVDSPLTTRQMTTNELSTLSDGGWSFSAINGNNDNDDDSTKAEYDSGFGDEQPDNMSFDSSGSTGVNNSPTGNTMEFEPTWGGVGAGQEHHDDSQAVDIHVPPPPEDDAVGDMD